MKLVVFDAPSVNIHTLHGVWAAEQIEELLYSELGYSKSSCEWFCADEDISINLDNIIYDTSSSKDDNW